MFLKKIYLNIIMSTLQYSEIEFFTKTEEPKKEEYKPQVIEYVDPPQQPVITQPPVSQSDINQLIELMKEQTLILRILLLISIFFVFIKIFENKA